MKHGADVLVGLHLQRVFCGKTVNRIVKVVRMRQLENVSREIQEHALESELHPITVNAQDDGLGPINRYAFQPVSANIHF